MHFTTILRNEKDNTDAIINKGYSLHLLKKYKQAILCFDKILKENPEDMNSLYLKAKSTVKQQNNKQSMYVNFKIIDN